MNLFFPEQLGAQVIVVHPADVGQTDLFRAFCFAGAGVGTAAKTFFVHLGNHAWARR
jgi:hypothetical protein